MMNLSEEIKVRRENIRDSTLKVYLSNLSTLNNKEPIINLDFLRDINVVSSKINKYAIPTQRNYIASIMVALSIYDGGDTWGEWKPTYEKYKKKLEDLTSDYQKNIEDHKKNQKQQDAWVSRKEQMKLINKYKRELKNIDFNIEKPSKAGIDIFQKLLVVSLYYYQSPRRLDYAPMTIVKRREDATDPNMNFLLVLNARKKYFIFNNYKTVRIHGRQELEVSKELNTILNKWLKVNKSNILMLNTKGEPLTSNGLSKLISRAFEPIKKGVTVNILRHVYTTEIVGTDIIEQDKERKKIAKEMGHTPTEQLNYIKL